MRRRFRARAAERWGSWRAGRQGFYPACVALLLVALLGGSVASATAGSLTLDSAPGAVAGPSLAGGVPAVDGAAEASGPQPRFGWASSILAQATPIDTLTPTTTAT